MALLLINAQTEFSKLIDQNDPAFLGHPSNISGVADNWSNVLLNYAGTAIPSSSTATVAAQAAKTVLLGATAPGSFFPLLVQAYSAFANTLAGGMVSGGSGMAPPVPIDFSPVLALPLSANSTPQIISLFSSITDAWFRTGTFIPTSGGSVPWS
jgi:hypothetical protein